MRANPFPSEAWAAAFAGALAAEAAPSAGPEWDGSEVALVARDGEVAIVISPAGGALSTACAVDRESARERAAFVLEGDLETWHALFGNDAQEPVKALLQGQLQLSKGRLPSLLSHIAQFDRLLRVAQRIGATA